MFGSPMVNHHCSIVPSEVATIETTTVIWAPTERVFDLARSIDLHQATASKTQEQAIAGVTSGLIGLGQEVTWLAKHFGLWQELTVRIVEFDRPDFFADEMVRGKFRSMRHEHRFSESPEGTVMQDVFQFEAPMGPLGKIVANTALHAYLDRFLRERNAILKQVAEGDEWRRYLDS